VGVLEPFLHWWTNLFNFIVGVIAVIGTLVYLALMDEDLSAHHWDFFTAILVLAIIGLLIVFVLQFIKRKRPQYWSAIRMRMLRMVKKGEIDDGNDGDTQLPQLSVHGDDEKKVPFDRISSNAPPPLPTTGRGKSRDSGDFVLDLTRACDECETNLAKQRCDECAQSLCDPCADDLHKTGKRSNHVLKRLSALKLAQTATSSRSTGTFRRTADDSIKVEEPTDTTE